MLKVSGRETKVTERDAQGTPSYLHLPGSDTKLSTEEPLRWSWAPPSPRCSLMRGSEPKVLRVVPKYLVQGNREQ